MEKNSNSPIIYFCDFEECKCNKHGKCITEEVWNCPKNNGYSVYENPELSKEIQNDN